MNREKERRKIESFTRVEGETCRKERKKKLIKLQQCGIYKRDVDSRPSEKAKEGVHLACALII